jgi:Xaa-Pro aminopeptidase
VTTDQVEPQLARRLDALARAWDLRDEIVVIGAGQPLPVPGRGDRTYPFRSHSEYLYLTDRERPGGVLAFDAAEGWADFVAPVSREERLWAGGPAGGQEGRPLPELGDWLAKRSRPPIANLGAPVAGVASDGELEQRLRWALNDLRRRKDEVELERMRVAAEATRAGFAAAAALVAPGRSERELQIELEAEFFRGGADSLAFDTIVASGPNSAVLHFAPTRRRAEPGELVLIDAGGEYRGYASDVTRTYPASGEHTAEQAELHELVVRAKLAATERCTPGTEFRDVHRAAALVIAEGLAEFGLLRGSAEDLVERQAVALFFPHGVGHMVGLGIRDAGEALPGRTSDPGALVRLRVDLPLEPGHVVTIEPGIYFVPALLAASELRKRFRHAVDWERADALVGFGGIRVEDDVLVTEGGPEVLTQAIPLTQAA